MPVFRDGEPGRAIHYEVRGAGPPVYLVHSLGTSGAIWSGLAAELAGRYRVVMPDLRGHGKTPRHAPITVPGMAEDLAALARGTGWAPAFWLGISMGGVVVQELYRRFRELVRGMVLACTFAHVDPAVARQRVEERRTFLAEHGMEAFARRYVEQTLLPTTPPERREPVLQAIAGMDVRAYLEATEAVFAADTRDVLPTVTVPTLVLGAERDAGFPPEHVRALAASIPGAALEIVPAAGHLAHLDNPRAFAGAVLSFLEKAVAAAGDFTAVRSAEERFPEEFAEGPYGHPRRPG